MLGLRDPVTGAHLWGGSDIEQRDLPVAAWFAAMNECDREVAGRGRTPSRSTAPGIEIALEDETEPADVIEELLAACQGQIAEAAGSWVIRAGPPAAAVFAFSDDDVIVTSPEELDPFPGLDQVFNGVSARYPEPEDGWQDKDAPRRVNAGYVAEDGGRLRVASLTFPAVPYRAQVQRLMASALKDGRRFRRHTVVLPPEARALGPLDVVEWTSERHGYEAKQFTVDLVEDLAERLRRPGAARGRSRPTTTSPPATSCRPASASSAGRTGCRSRSTSAPRASACPMPPAMPAGPASSSTGIRCARPRACATSSSSLDRPDDAAVLGGHDTSDDDYSPSYLEVFAGVPLEVETDTPLVAATFSDIRAGTTIITAGVLPAAGYRIRARYVPNGGWCPWIAVETPDTRVSRARPRRRAQQPHRHRDDEGRRRGGRCRGRARQGAGRARPGDDARRRHHRRPRGAARSARRHGRRRHRRRPAARARRAADRLERRPDLPALELGRARQVVDRRARRPAPRRSPASTAAASRSTSRPARAPRR